MKREIPLGVNLQKMTPVSVLVIVDSISEKKLLQQYFRAVEFYCPELEDDILANIIDKLNGVVSDPDAKTSEDDEFGEEIRMSGIFAALSDVDILCIEYNFKESAAKFIQKIQHMFPGMKVILILDNVTGDMVEDIKSLKVNAFLVKPISKNSLYDKLKLILKRSDLLQREVTGHLNTAGIDLKNIQIPPLSEVLARVVMFHSDRSGGSEELEKIISPDKSLSADVMRIANSSYYGRSGSVKTLKDAITLIGLKTINNIAIVKARRTYTENLKNPVFKKYLEEFPILTGLIAMDLSAPLGLGKLNDEIFIHSVLIKIGMTILALNRTQSYSRILKKYSQGTKSLIYFEREEYNTDYIEIGLRLFRIWRLPLSMQDILKNQEFTVRQIQDVSDLDRLLRISELFALKLIGLITVEDMKLIYEILQYYNAKEEIIELLDKEYYSHIKNHPFFDLINSG